MKTESMMKAAAGLALAGLLLAGCVQSLQPLYTDKDLVFEPKLVGVWAEGPEAKERWSFEPAGERGYQVIYEEEGKRGLFEAHLLRLDEHLYLDFFPDDEAMKAMDSNDFYRYHWLPTHTFARVYAVEPELAMAFMEPDWLEEYLSDHPDAIDHVRRGDDQIILTASTKSLQEFVRQHADDAFGDGNPEKLHRINPAD